MARAAGAAAELMPAAAIAAFESLTDDAIEHARSAVRAGDAVLVKASRGMEMERIIAAFEASPASSAAKPARRQRQAARTSSSATPRKKRQPA
jgi:hypothetical protein